MKFLKETTEWNTPYKMPNHTYILDGTTCVGYIPDGTDIAQMFNHPLKNFDKKGRTFKVLTKKDIAKCKVK